MRGAIPLGVPVAEKAEDLLFRDLVEEVRNLRVAEHVHPFGEKLGA